VKACEQAGDKSSGPLIGGGKEAVDGTVFSGNAAAGMLSTDGALAGVDNRPTTPVGQRLVLRHGTFTSLGQLTKGAKVIPTGCLRPDGLLKLSLDND
jgi:hypothetical protein